MQRKPERFTMVFEGDLREFKGNPMKALTDWGPPEAVGVGDAFARLDAYEAALRPLASLPIGPEIEDDHDLVIYKNAGRSITVGDILAARKALEDNT